MRFADPLFLLFLLLIPAHLWLRARHGRSRPPALRYPSGGLRPPRSLRTRLRDLPLRLGYAALALLVVALARPQAGRSVDEIPGRGIDIMLALDTSSSMQALDFQPDDRLDAAKKVAKDFVANRRHDRIGVVVFAGLAFTQCPLTIDHDAVLGLLEDTRIGMTGIDGTAVGSAIATAANRLKDAPGESRVVILLTDGRSNMGEVDPVTAAEAAAALGIRVYTVGAGKPGGALFPVRDPFTGGTRYVKIPDQDLDEPTLTKVAEKTGGRYFRATDAASLREIFAQIDEMETTGTDAKRYTDYRELFGYPLGAGLILLTGGVLLGGTWLRRVP